MSDGLTERPGTAACAGTVAGRMHGPFPTKVELVNPTDQVPLAHEFPLVRAHCGKHAPDWAGNHDHYRLGR
jgi:hypothetical protein